MLGEFCVLGFCLAEDSTIEVDNFTKRETRYAAAPFQSCLAEAFPINASDDSAEQLRENIRKPADLICRP